MFVELLGFAIPWSASSVPSGVNSGKDSTLAPLVSGVWFVPSTFTMYTPSIEASSGERNTIFVGPEVFDLSMDVTGTHSFSALRHPALPLPRRGCRMGGRGNQEP
jgi:hypothetical protein